MCIKFSKGLSTAFETLNIYLDFNSGRFYVKKIKIRPIFNDVITPRFRIINCTHYSIRLVFFR